RIEDALAHINRGDRPLALYWFGSDRAAREQVMRETHAGGVTINDCLWHFGQQDQPIGGVGASGMGAYHGEWGFRTCSKEKPLFIQSRWAGTAL
ncbi:aldehyde dehydrogenase family protein, partial [Acinetobacter baumannii]